GAAWRAYSGMGGGGKGTVAVYGPGRLTECDETREAEQTMAPDPGTALSRGRLIRRSRPRCNSPRHAPERPRQPHDVRAERPVLEQGRHELAHAVVHRASARPQLLHTHQDHGLRGGEQYDRDHAARCREQPGRTP